VPSTSGGTVRLIRGDARSLPMLADASVHLIVTSPPYPMIPQWDALFAALGARDYPSMLRVLEDAWREAHRLLVDGGLLAVVVGDALRGGEEGFRLWPNHAETLVAAARVGFRPLPYLLWKKPTNKPNAYLGSGFLPPNAYVTLDCEFVLLFRKGRLRRFPVRDARRAESRFTREERDLWFSQVWDDIRGAPQDRLGRRTGAFPARLAERLVRMFSVRGDTVLDPFAGTGTTVRVAAGLGRHAVGVEWDPAVYRALARAAREGAWGPPVPADGPTRSPE
jgi:DNA modification methylase